MPDAPADIRMFVAAFEERSFTIAAHREHATQPGVSQHIRKLETRLGVQLFIRKAATIEPTPAGEEFYRHCLRVLRAHEAAMAGMVNFNGSLEGELVIGLMPTMTRCAAAPALALFLDMHPNVSVRIVEAYSAVLTERVRAGELAFAIVPASPTGPGLRARLFARTPEVLVTTSVQGIKHGEPVRLAELGSLKFVLPGPQNTRRQTLETYFAANDVDVIRRLQLDSMMTTLDLVACSDWAAILPGVMMAQEDDARNFTIRPLAQPSLSLDLVLIEPAHRALDRAAALFHDALEIETKRASARWALQPE